MIQLLGQLSEKGLKPFVDEQFILNGHKIHKIWIMVADAQKAFFFRKPDHHLEKIDETHPI